MAGSGIAFALAGRWCEMDKDIRHPGQSRQAGTFIQISQQRHSPRSAPAGTTTGIAQQGEHAAAPGMQHQAGEDAAGDVPAADNQDFLHAGIVAEPQKGNR